jgi:hypothetical protein
MRNMMPFAPLLLAACATAPVPATIPVHGETPGHECNGDATDQFIGQSVSSGFGDAVLRATHAAILRWAAPGVMLTMDFRADRVTVWYGPDNKVTKVHCG